RWPPSCCWCWRRWPWCRWQRVRCGGGCSTAPADRTCRRAGRCSSTGRPFGWSVRTGSHLVAGGLVGAGCRCSRRRLRVLRGGRAGLSAGLPGGCVALGLGLPRALVGVRGGRGDGGQGGLHLLTLRVVHLRLGRCRLVLLPLVLPAAGGPRAVRATGVRTTGAALHRFGVHDEATALAVLARLAERLDQTLAHPLAGHL